jgi:hypothetical protein
MALPMNQGTNTNGSPGTTQETYAENHWIMNTDVTEENILSRSHGFWIHHMMSRAQEAMVHVLNKFTSSYIC